MLKLIILIIIFVVSTILSLVTMPPVDNHYWWLMGSRQDIKTLNTSVELFRLDNRRFPAPDEGIQILVANTSADLPKWKQYIREVPFDTWGEPYVYELNSSGTDFLVYSSGPNFIPESGLGDDIIGGEKEYACELYSECTKFIEHVWVGATILALISLLLLIVSVCYYLIRLVWRTSKKNKA